jgi:hypothetical protein
MRLLRSSSRAAGGFCLAAAAASASPSLASADAASTLAAGGTGGSAGAEGSEVVPSAAGSSHWLSPPVVVALGEGQAGTAGVVSEPEPEADIPKAPGTCGCLASGRDAQPASGWCWVFIAGLAAGARWTRLRHAAVARRTNIG